MKNLLFLLGITMLASCQIDNVCVSCTETQSGYVADDFCGDELEAEIYMNLLEDDGESSTTWVCTKKR